MAGLETARGSEIEGPLSRVQISHQLSQAEKNIDALTYRGTSLLSTSIFSPSTWGRSIHVTHAGQVYRMCDVSTYKKLSISAANSS